VVVSVFIALFTGVRSRFMLNPPLEITAKTTVLATGIFSPAATAIGALPHQFLHPNALSSVVQKVRESSLKFFESSVARGNGAANIRDVFN
jgi:hypothetical protein